MASHRLEEALLLEAISNLHDHLWAGGAQDEAKLLARLLAGARDLDRHLASRGRVERAVRPMVREFQKVTHGADLFTFLHAVAHLTAAADRVYRKPQEAAKHASELVVSLCIHLAASAGRHDLTEGFESGQTDFAEYTSRLADVLEERGVLRAGELRRAANQAFDLHALWDRQAPPESKRLMSTAAVASAALACVFFTEALRSLGRFRERPYGQLVPVADTVLGRLGAHP